MRSRGRRATGARVDDLQDELYAALDIAHRYSGESVTVLMMEQYEFLWTNSNMQTTVILERTGPDEMHVELMVGGGSVGILNLTFGSEKKVLQSVWSDVVDACDRLDLTLRGQTREDTQFDWSEYDEEHRQ